MSSGEGGGGFRGNKPIPQASKETPQGKQDIKQFEETEISSPRFKVSLHKGNIKSLIPLKYTKLNILPMFLMTLEVTLL